MQDLRRSCRSIILLYIFTFRARTSSCDSASLILFGCGLALHYAVAYAVGRCTAIFFGDFSAGAVASVQLILRRCGSGVVGVERNAARSSARQALHLSLTFRISPRSPPCSFFCTCIPQGAIDFAALRMRSKWWSWGFKRQPRVSHRSPSPQTFRRVQFAECN